MCIYSSNNSLVRYYYYCNVIIIISFYSRKNTVIYKDLVIFLKSKSSEKSILFRHNQMNFKELRRQVASWISKL